MDTDLESSDQTMASPNRRGLMSRLMGALAWLAVTLSVIGISVLWWIAPSFDFAFVNVLTVFLGFFLWLGLVVGFQTSRLPRLLWRTCLLLPILFSICWLVLYRVERVDGDLRPKFVSRWLPPPDLPISEGTETGIAAELLQPRDTDFLQFLGPERNATIANRVIETDWQTHPPEILWKVPIGDGWSGFAVQGDIGVTMEQRASQEWVSAYDIRNGELLWHFAFDALHTNPMGGTGPRATPTIGGQFVYAASAVNDVVCLNLANGELIWKQELLEIGGYTQSEFEDGVSWGRSGSPLLYEGQLIVPLGGPNADTLVAFDAASGEQQWTAGTEQISYSSPTIMELGGIEQLLLVTENHLRSFALDTHQELWSVPWPGNSAGEASTSQPVRVDSQHILLSKGYGQGCQLIELKQDGEQWMTEVAWKNESALKTKFTSAVVFEDHAYALSDGILECVALADGRRIWKKGRYKQGQLLLVGRQLLITTEDGDVVLVDADPNGFRERARLPVIGDVTWNTPALSGDRLVMRNSDEAACVRLPMQ